MSANIISYASYRNLQGIYNIIILLLGRVALVRGVAAYSRQTFPWTICRSVGAYVRRSVCPVHCGKTAYRIRMPFGVVDRTGPGMRQVVGFGDRSTEKGTSGGEFATRHCNQWGIYGVRVRQSSTVRAAVWGGACGRPRHYCIR